MLTSRVFRVASASLPFFDSILKIKTLKQFYTNKIELCLLYTLSIIKSGYPLMLTYVYVYVNLSLI